MSQDESARLAQELAQARAQIDTLNRRLADQAAERTAVDAMLKFRDGVIEHAADGVCVCQDTAEFPFVKFTVWNRRMVEITGYEMDEINRRGWYQTLYPDPAVQERARARMDRMRTGDDLRFERWVIQCADGTPRPLAISTSVLVTDEGSVHVLGLMHDLSPQETLLEESWRARTDELTGVRNRRGFHEEAELLIQLARRQRQAVTLAFIDVRGFKGLNDAQGHAEGDRALKEIGQTLSTSVRALDVVGRLGGDEFALLLPGMRSPRARTFFPALADRMTQASLELGWTIGFSVGVVTYPDQVPSVDEVLARADRLMYRAKQADATCVEFEEVCS